MDDVTTISTEVNVLEDHIPAIPASWKNPEVLFCANTHPRSQVAVLDQCPGAVITALDSFMLWIETEFELLSEALRKVDLAILNEEEVCAIAGDDLVHNAAAKISSGEALYGGIAAGPGPRGVIVKRGRSGSVAYLFDPVYPQGCTVSTLQYVHCLHYCMQMCYRHHLLQGCNRYRTRF